MKRFVKHILALSAMTLMALTVSAQDVSNSSSSSGIVRRRADDKGAKTSDPSTNVSPRMKQRFEKANVSDADMEWMRVIYRQLDLTKPANSPLYYPTDADGGEENLFRIIMRVVADGSVPAYEFLDGREVFTPDYMVNVDAVLPNAGIPHFPAKGSTEKNPKYEIAPSDLPAHLVENYYVIEQWEFDRRHNRLRPQILAICPVLDNLDEYGDTRRIAMFWVKYEDLRPYIMNRTIFLSDDNNLPSGNYDDYFQMQRYDGEIYKTRNMRNRLLSEMHAGPEALKRAQDSIQASLDSFENRMWVPTLAELRESKDGSKAVEAASDSTSVAPAKAGVRSSRSASKRRESASKSKPKVKNAPKPKNNSGSSSAARSVRNRRR
ncbi:MAG: gliding motility protein GldN [Paramuribaculum sp.]|nr:gliding motility protein GldN [Paramuribaculum sp.]